MATAAGFKVHKPIPLSATAAPLQDSNSTPASTCTTPIGQTKTEGNLKKDTSKDKSLRRLGHYKRLGKQLGIPIDRQLQSSVPVLLDAINPQPPDSAPDFLQDRSGKLLPFPWPSYNPDKDEVATALAERGADAAKPYKSVARYLLEEEDDLWSLRDKAPSHLQQEDSEEEEKTPTTNTMDKTQQQQQSKSMSSLDTQKFEERTMRNSKGDAALLSPNVYAEEPPLYPAPPAGVSSSGNAGTAAGASLGAEKKPVPHPQNSLGPPPISPNHQSFENSRAGTSTPSLSAAEKESGTAMNGSSVKKERAAADAFRHVHHHDLEGGLAQAARVGEATRKPSFGTSPTSRRHRAESFRSISSSGRLRESSFSGGAGYADGIGGAGLGTAATGDLGERHQFETLEQIRAGVRELEASYNAQHPDKPLSGRIIHVSHYIPFVVRALAEVDFEQKQAERLTATDSVAAMAAAARRKKAMQQAEKQKQDILAGGGLKKIDRQPSMDVGASQMALDGLDGQDMEKRLAENQARSKLHAGRRAWMMTPVIDDSSDHEDSQDDLMSWKDRFTPVHSRRQSSAPGSRASSFGAGASGMTSGNIFPGATEPESNSWTPPELISRPTKPATEREDPAQWVLTPRRGHTALNSGVRSLCKTHRQTFIGWPGDMVFAAQARNDDRKDPSQTTEAERRQIEKLLADLDDAKNWAAHAAPVVGAPKNDSGQEPISRVPTPLMNGAEPLAPAASKKVIGRPEKGSLVGSQKDNGIKYVPVWLDYKTAHGHYEGYCKTVLWPLLHYLLWQDVNTERQSSWDDHSWDAYYNANHAFAKRIAEEYKPGDMVIVHDYHLLLVPGMLRKLVPDGNIALFMHAPFPSSEVFRCLPKRREIIEGMLGADLACFQAFSYSRHFLSSCIRVCGLDASYNSVESPNGHVTSISYNPIGIDAEKISKDSTGPGVKPKIEVIKEMYKGKKIIVGRDKLDIVRGVLQKLQAFQKFLEEFPEWRGKVVLIQVTAPALNDSPTLERQVSELVSHINSTFGSLSFTPVHHYHQIIERDEYFALLSVADLALITSVRDGMNTTSMEYIICQEQIKKSPLILSEFTGTAGRMRSAIQVNPWNIWGVAKAIDYGLRLSEEERLSRHKQLYDQVTLHTSHTWAATLVKQLAYRLSSEEAAHFTPPLDMEAVQQKFHAASKRLLLLDYDGTLTPIVKQPEAAVPSKELLQALETLSNDPRNLIYIISGRDQTFLSKHLGHIKNIGFSAEHGCFVKEPGQSEWLNLTLELDMSWMPDIRSMFEYYTERTSGSNIEQKKSSITWHYRNSDPDYGSFQSKECQAHLENLTATNNLAIEVLLGKKNLEVRPLAVNKGEIVKRILYDNTDAEFVFCAGDDKTDEDMFRALVNLCRATGPDSPIMSATNLSTGHGSNGTAKGKPTNAQVDGLKKESSEDAPLIMSPPTPLNQATPLGSPKPLRLKRDGIFATTVGPSGKKTLGHWHVENPHKVISTLAAMAAGPQ